MINDKKFPLKLTPGGSLYGSELSLAHVGGSTRVAVWIDRKIEKEEQSEKICWRVIQPDGLGRIVSAPPVQGALSSPKVCGQWLIWREFDDARGVIYYAKLDTNLERMGTAPPVTPLRDFNSGEFSCAIDPSGTLWLLSDVWSKESVTLRLVALKGNEWIDYGNLSNDGVFCVRPRLIYGKSGLMASWDEFTNGSHRGVTAELTGEVPIFRELPAPPDCRETLSAIACVSDGTWFAARCREKLVEFEGGIATYHSELVVAALEPDADEWRDVAFVDIDHAMNPWLSPYVGMRRFPHLIAYEQGVWLLWEEKEKPQEARPSPGRLCVLAVTEEGDKAQPMIALSGLCRFVIESDGVDTDLLVASKFQHGRDEQRLPYLLHHVNLEELSEARCSELETNRDAPSFVVRPSIHPRPTLKQLNFKLFFGDPHLHSHFSGDLDGEQTELYHFARHVAKLDFVAFTDNDFHWLIEPMSEATWEINRRNANFFNKPGKFTALLGWEYTKHGGYSIPLDSHRNVIFPGGDGEVYTWHEDRTPTPKALVEKFRGQRVLLHHHHCGPLDISDDSMERNIELCSGWANCMRRQEFVDKLHALLKRGFRLGFIGASDNHERTPGLGGALTGVWATENTREAIFDAFFSRRIFATTGLRPDLRFRVSGTFMGGETETHRQPVIQLEARCDSAVRKTEIIRDGQIVHTAPQRGKEIAIEWRDDSCAPGEHFYYAHVLFEGEKVRSLYNAASAYGVDAWTSPVWVHFVKE